MTSSSLPPQLHIRPLPPPLFSPFFFVPLSPASRATIYFSPNILPSLLRKNIITGASAARRRRKREERERKERGKEDLGTDDLAPKKRKEKKRGHFPNFPPGNFFCVYLVASFSILPFPFSHFPIQQRRELHISPRYKKKPRPPTPSFLLLFFHAEIFPPPHYYRRRISIISSPPPPPPSIFLATNLSPSFLLPFLFSSSPLTPSSTFLFSPFHTNQPSVSGSFFNGERRGERRFKSRMGTRK